MGKILRGRNAETDIPRHMKFGVFVKLASVHREKQKMGGGEFSRGAQPPKLCTILYLKFGDDYLPHLKPCTHLRVAEIGA